MAKSLKSPFPSMDPFLEDAAYGSDFHATFINYYREHIADRLPDHYDARLGERVYLVEQGPEAKKLSGPDVAVSRAQERKRKAPKRATGTATLHPVTIPVVVLDESRQGYIEIIHQPDRDLVATLELLSPGNKENRGRNAYVAKRSAFWNRKIHVVQLDLLLKGRRLPLGAALPDGDYHYFVSRGEHRPDCQVFSWHLRDGCRRCLSPCCLATPT